MAELASLLLMDPIDGYDELAVMVPPIVLLAFYSPIAAFSPIYGFGLCLAFVFAKDCTDYLLIEGMTCHEIKQLPRHSWFAAPELVDKYFIGHARDERSNHVHVYDVEKLVALHGKAADVLA